jgi:hypothetical protein
LPEGSPRLTDGLNVMRAYDIDLFALRESGSIEFKASRGSFDGFLGGSLQTRGGYQLDLADGSTIPLVDFRLRPSASNPMQLDVVSGDGKVWFYVDNLMYELVRDNRVLAFYTSDMRINRALAERTGHPDMAGQPAGELEILTQVTRQGSGGIRDVTGIPSPSHWHGDPVPGQPGSFYQADLFMQSISVSRVEAQGNTGPNGIGRVAFAPSSTLRNNVNNGTASATVANQGALGTSTALYAAWIPWYTKFSGNFAPYSNDQHPYLIWNMYRINADGGIEQIGRSGVKHAFLTTNGGCATGENFSSHVLGRSCSDTYSTGNNDSNGSLSFRSEIIPSTNQWGRCHSLFDPGCVGSNTNPSPPDDGFVRRLVVNESQISNTVNPDASYLFDSWYLARRGHQYLQLDGYDYRHARAGPAATGHLLGKPTSSWVRSPTAGSKTCRQAPKPRTRKQTSMSAMPSLPFVLSISATVSSAITMRSTTWIFRVQSPLGPNRISMSSATRVLTSSASPSPQALKSSTTASAMVTSLLPMTGASATLVVS